MLEDAAKRMREKYKRMLSLRLERERLEAQGVLRLEGDEARERRRASQALAKAFPGALKQLDTMDSGLMERRLDELEAWPSEGGSPSVPHWCQLEACYHALLFDFLGAKSWLAEHAGAGFSDTEIWRMWQERGFFSEAVWLRCGFGQELVQIIRRPPAGRLSEVVWKSLAQVFREPADVLKAQFAAWREEH